MKEKERFEILLEEIRNNNRVTQEGQDFLNRKIDNLKQDVKVVDNKFAYIAKGHSEKLNKIEGEIGTIKGNINDLKVDLNDLRTDLSSKITKVLDKVENHENRITVLERRN